jgi:hypothetical protein
MHGVFQSRYRSPNPCIRSILLKMHNLNCRDDTDIYQTPLISPSPGPRGVELIYPIYPEIIHSPGFNSWPSVPAPLVVFNSLSPSHLKAPIFIDLGNSLMDTWTARFLGYRIALFQLCSTEVG